MNLKPWQSLGLLIGGAVLLLYGTRAKASGHRPIDWSHDRVLLIGDSLAVGLRPKFESLRKVVPGFAFHAVAKEGAKIGAFNGDAPATGGGLAQALTTFRPTVVFISLGTNDEVARRSNPSADVAATTQADVDKLLSKFRGMRVIWIGPPSFAPSKWQMDTNFRRMLASKVGEENYFDTAIYPIPRASDGIHMAGSGYADWAKRIIAWVEAGNSRR